jgi:hypothetical protein
MPSKCIADKPLKDAKGKDFKGFQIFNGKHKGQYKQGETYPEKFLAHKWKHDFERVEAQAEPPKPPKNKPEPKAKNGGDD